MPNATGATVYRYTGPKRPKVAPFAGVPARDLEAADVERLPLGTVKLITGGDKPLYVAVSSRAAKADAQGAPTDTPAAKAAKAEAPAEKEG
jgi:hypothetical protein